MLSSFYLIVHRFSFCGATFSRSIACSQFPTIFNHTYYPNIYFHRFLFISPKFDSFDLNVWSAIVTWRMGHFLKRLISKETDFEKIVDTYEFLPCVCSLLHQDDF